ncbi:hypothetical protein BDZ90DRAFT_281021 [Jaminaea rosea]|uniref:1-phosphatidylinositol 4-kinase n=1 Tax=Jaminaea rosea TaxID=1569628 RepID=A0A316UNX4_9BASI|nr:hypothetical protein BDZ90DRAFT_281021 [Jaminaea rosea]PWN26051.1 hypothetical protein BDZ90DRAFT_281021 [Jaminaea rosea]
MDSLDLPTHQLILDGLASNLADSILANDVDHVKPEHLSALTSSASASSSKASKLTGGSGHYLSINAAHSLISLSRFLSSISSAVNPVTERGRVNDQEHLIPVLNDVINATKSLTATDVEALVGLANEWPLADRLAGALVESLLKTAGNAPQHRAKCFDAIVVLAENLSAGLGASSGDAHIVVTRLVPMLHGLYRALSSTTFKWTLPEFARLVTALTPVTGTSQTVQRLNHVLLVLPEQQAALAQGTRATRRKPKEATIRRRDEEEDDEDDGRSHGSTETFFSGDEGDDIVDEVLNGGFTYTQGQDVMGDESFDYRYALLSHYKRLGRPLSGHFVLCSALEILGSVLSQTLASHARAPEDLDANLQPQQNGTAQNGDQPQQPAPPHIDTIDAAVDNVSPGTTSQLPTQRAWQKLYRHAVTLDSTDKASLAAANGSANGNGSGFLSSLVGGNKSAAFGSDGVSLTGNTQGVAASLHLASRAYHDVQRFIEKEGRKNGQLFNDVYSLEILSEALKLGALSSIALSRVNNSALDAHTLVRIRALLSESAIIIDPILQGAALQSAGVLVRNFPSIVGPLSTQLRRFVVSPQAMFISDGTDISPVLDSAAKCLANCVTIAPGDDLAVSTMYALLNHIGRESNGSAGAGGLAASGMSVRSGLSKAVTGRDFSMGKSHSQALFAQRNEEEKRIIHLSIVTIVSRLALEINRPDVTGLAISMLLQRLRTADAEAEAAILNNLVPLALAGHKSTFVDVIRALTQVSRSAISGGANRRTGLPIQLAQLRLAQGLGALREEDDRIDSEEEAGLDTEEDRFGSIGRKELYLVELLQLFSEKGLALQASASSSSKGEQSELATDLASLLPPIAALLSHDDINPHLEPSIEMVSLFRNMWFLCVIFNLANKAGRGSSSVVAGDDAVADSLSIISLKTPTLVPETSVNYLESDLQYNSVLKRDFSSSALDSQRKLLDSVIPNHSSEIRSFGFPQVIFLATIYHLECTRSAMGRPSMILWYFVNQGLNKSSLVGSMDAIADRVIASFIDDLSSRVNKHTVDPRVSAEVKNLLLGSCHRVEKVRAVSRRFLDRLVNVFPSLICDQDVVFALLEILTLLRRACEGQYRDEFSPVYHFHSERAKLAFELSDSYTQREEILSGFYTRAKSYLGLSLGRAPVELQGILQRYLAAFDDDVLPGTAELGKSLALDYARALPASGVSDYHLPALGGWRSDLSSSFVGELTSKSTYQGEMTGIHLALTKTMVELKKDPRVGFSHQSVESCKEEMRKASEALTAGHAHAHAADGKAHHGPLPFAELRRLLYRSAALVVSLPHADFDLLHHIVALPIRAFTPQAITVASHVWTWIIGERPLFETKIMVELSIGWAATVKAKRGLFQDDFTSKHALIQKTEMSASDRAEFVREGEKANRLFMPHLTLVQLMSSRFQAFRYRDPTMVLALVRMLQRSAAATDHMSAHPLARQAFFSLVLFGFQLVQGSQLDGLVEYKLRTALYGMAFHWFAHSPQFSHGSNRLQSAAEMQLLRDLLATVKADSVRSKSITTSYIGVTASAIRLPGYLTLQEAQREADDRRAVLTLFLEDELRRLSVWQNPLEDPTRGSDYSGDMARTMNDAKWEATVLAAWKIKPALVAQLPVRFKAATVRREAGKLVRAEPHKVYKTGDALNLLTEDHLRLALREQTDLRWLLYWGSVSPIDAICLFQPVYGNNPMLLQYAMRTLEHHPVDLTFFYVPQVVQALRDDQYGYVEQFIFETSKVSQLFCHQILWNMKANSYQDDDGEVPDPMKPTLDRMTELIVEALDGEAQDFYDREFGFFNEVTSISGKLKPYIKKSKPEKKAKIDEEMAAIKVDPGVYLPSNPDGVVVDLDRKSGRPLQSHAKAPFMATFKVHRDVTTEDPESGEETTKGVDVWQGAIFKVGDDCRQDVLALQVMAMLKNIYTAVGLDAYLYPYRVTATGPGCGVIDVVANATSRDEMGRSKINSLLDFFVGRFGNVDSIPFQRARLNFIQSMAAYSIACHVMQCRDRHNGNIMIQNDTGHLVHIDFGFLFDIGPGGMHFEPYSFKLTAEFIEVMGGIDSQGYKLFSELVVKAFLAARPYVDEIVGVCDLMKHTGLPSYTDGNTMKRFRSRFVPEMDERQAARHAVGLINDASKNIRSIVYDGIQKAQNGIPFK